jgi:hypothetical protein
MNIYKISQDVNVDVDTYDSAIVCAESEDEARKIHPSEWDNWTTYDWCKIQDVKVELIGIANTNQIKGVILSSFNKG